jgi:hypothetical protein
MPGVLALLQEGVDLITVKELLGHGSVTITERYTHSRQDLKKNAVGLLSDKASKQSQKGENLLHLCDTAKTENYGRLRSHLFSAN